MLLSLLLLSPLPLPASLPLLPPLHPLPPLSLPLVVVHVLHLIVSQGQHPGIVDPVDCSTHMRCRHLLLPAGCAVPCCADGEESVQDVWAAELGSATLDGSHSGSASASGRSIVAADVSDPYVLLLLSDGTAAVLAADAGSCRLAPLDAGSSSEAAAAAAAALQPTAAEDRLTACSLHSDSCGWLQRALGDGSSSSGSSSSGGMYSLLCRASGACQLYALPTWQLAFSSTSLAEGAALLANGGGADDADVEPAAVVEARLVSFGAVAGSRTDAAAARASSAPACEAPYLLVLTADHQLLAYKAFAAGSGRGVRFRRLQLDLPPLLPPAAGAGQPGLAAEQEQQQWRLQRLHCFEGLGEEAPYSGVFVTGGWVDG